MPPLTEANYMGFPLRIGPDGALTSKRKEHVKQQIEQVLFTSPGERVFLPEFGAGVRNLLFEPNASPLWEVTKKRLLASLAEALRGEVDPKTLDVEVCRKEEKLCKEEKLFITISYTLAAIGHKESHTLVVE